MPGDARAFPGGPPLFSEVTQVKKKNILWRILDNIEMALAGVILTALVLSTFLGVVARYLYNAPFNWLEEMQLAAMVWIAFLVAGVAFRRGSHVAIEIVVDSLPQKAQRVVEVLIAIVVYAVLIYFLRSSIKYIQLFLKTRRCTPMLGIPYAHIYGIGPVSAVLMMISYTVVLWRRVKERRTRKEETP